MIGKLSRWLARQDTKKANLIQAISFGIAFFIFIEIKTYIVDGADVPLFENLVILVPVSIGTFFMAYLLLRIASWVDLKLSKL